MQWLACQTGMGAHACNQGGQVNIVLSPMQDSIFGLLIAACFVQGVLARFIEGRRDIFC